MLASLSFLLFMFETKLFYCYSKNSYHILLKVTISITTDKALFHPKTADIFLISQ